MARRVVPNLRWLQSYFCYTVNGGLLPISIYNNEEIISVFGQVLEDGRIQCAIKVDGHNAAHDHASCSIVKRDEFLVHVDYTMAIEGWCGRKIHGRQQVQQHLNHDCEICADIAAKLVLIEDWFGPSRKDQPEIRKQCQEVDPSGEWYF